MMTCFTLNPAYLHSIPESRHEPDTLKPLHL
jgi:hypothetical protein